MHAKPTAQVLVFDSGAEPAYGKGVHVLGDVIAGVAGMPKSGPIDNQSAKVRAAPLMPSVAYTSVSPAEALSTSAVYRYDAGKKTMAPVNDAGSSSTVPSVESGLYGMSWAANILNAPLGQNKK